MDDPSFLPFWALEFRGLAELPPGAPAVAERRTASRWRGLAVSSRQATSTPGSRAAGRWAGGGSGGCPRARPFRHSGCTRSCTRERSASVSDRRAAPANRTRGTDFDDLVTTPRRVPRRAEHRPLGVPEWTDAPPLADRLPGFFRGGFCATSCTSRWQPPHGSSAPPPCSSKSRHPARHLHRLPGSVVPIGLRRMPLQGGAREIPCSH